MAQCTLDINHPVFQHAISKWDDDLSFHEGLLEAKNKIEAEHTSCNRFVQPMPKHPECMNKIWKYDWAPEGQSSSTRKAWRMIVIVLEPNQVPYQLTAAAIYPKSATTQLTTKQLIAILISIRNPTTTPEPDPPEQFKRVKRSEGVLISICQECCETVATSSSSVVLNTEEEAHDCPGPITAKSQHFAE